MLSSPPKAGVLVGVGQQRCPIAPGGKDSFIAHVAPDAMEIGVGGQSRALRTGMRGEARIQVGRRTLIESAFEPLRQLRENMRSQPPRGEK